MYLYVKDNMKTKNQLLRLKGKYEEQLNKLKQIKIELNNIK